MAKQNTAAKIEVEVDVWERPGSVWQTLIRPESSEIQTVTTVRSNQTEPIICPRVFADMLNGVQYACERMDQWVLWNDKDYEGTPDLYQYGYTERREIVSACLLGSIPDEWLVASTYSIYSATTEELIATLERRHCYGIDPLQWNEICRICEVFAKERNENVFFTLSQKGRGIGQCRILQTR